MLPTANKNYVFVAVETDSQIVGYGEATLDQRYPSVVAGIHEGFKLLAGQDPTAVNRHWATMRSKVFWSDGASSCAALAALELALWDITGKAYGQPVHKLLGGAVRDTVDVYLNQWWSGFKDTDDLIRKARLAVERGATKLKWYPFGSRHSFPYNVSNHGVRRAVDQVRSMREALGPDIGLMVDVWRHLDWAAAVQFCKGVTDFELLFVEEPTEYQSADAFARLSAATGARIAFGERLHSRRQFADIIEKQAVGLVQPSILRVGGLSEALRIGSTAETYSIGVAPHNPHGPVSTAATVALASLLPNFVVMETYDNNYPPVLAEFVQVGPVIVGDHFDVTDRPGLGVEIDEEKLAVVCGEVGRLAA